MSDLDPPVARGRVETAPHGARSLRGLTVEGYSLDLWDADGMVGDRASQTAFREILARWHDALARGGEGALGDVDIDAMSKRDLDALAVHGDSDAQRAIALAVEEFAKELARVVSRFASHPSWKGVRRVAVGGGFKESSLGRLALIRAGGWLRRGGKAITLQALQHHADDAGLVGWVHALPVSSTADRDCFLAVDLGGTNVRCGIVQSQEASVGTGSTHARVLAHRKWRHAQDDPAQNGLVDGVATMLREIADEGAAQGLTVSPWIGVGCPGVIERDGSIDRGAQNLPGDWERPGFHLPSLLEERLGSIAGRRCRAVLHNDAVIQGLSEVPSMRAEEAWAVLTIGTGLGNASFVNVRGVPLPTP